MIWCGKLARCKSCLPPKMYAKLNQEIQLAMTQDISPCFAEMFMAVFNVNYVYDDCGLQVLYKSEPYYRSYLFDNCKATIKYLRSVSHIFTSFPREIELDTMTTQLQPKGTNDHWYKYNTDGTLRANDISSTEILLTKVSSDYRSNDAGKISFDHYKAMFGMLAMI
ncbi:hypothetical protein CLU79DRAFT_780551 [Phycomyces nitens]|nr:hypothetical protein CLU79DRAFT_780551 [Phycomyces nitens]